MPAGAAGTVGVDVATVGAAGVAGAGDILDSVGDGAGV
jgi:hypothetical protein